MGDDVNDGDGDDDDDLSISLGHSSNEYINAGYNVCFAPLRIFPSELALTIFIFLFSEGKSLLYKVDVAVTGGGEK